MHLIFLSRCKSMYTDFLLKKHIWSEHSLQFSQLDTVGVSVLICRGKQNKAELLFFPKHIFLMNDSFPWTFFQSEETGNNWIKIFVHYNKWHVIVKSCQDVFGAWTQQEEFVIKGGLPSTAGGQKSPHGVETPVAVVVTDDPAETEWLMKWWNR